MSRARGSIRRVSAPPQRARSGRAGQCGELPRAARASVTRRRPPEEVPRSFVRLPDSTTTGAPRCTMTTRLSPNRSCPERQTMRARSDLSTKASSACAITSGLSAFSPETRFVRLWNYVTGRKRSCECGRLSGRRAVRRSGSLPVRALVWLDLPGAYLARDPLAIVSVSRGAAPSRVARRASHSSYWTLRKRRVQGLASLAALLRG